jgi:hypothetical protein
MKSFLLIVSSFIGCVALLLYVTQPGCAASLARAAFCLGAIGATGALIATLPRCMPRKAGRA